MRHYNESIFTFASHSVPLSCLATCFCQMNSILHALFTLTFSQNCDVSNHFFANHSKYVSPVLSRHVFELRKKVNWLCCCRRLTKKTAILKTNARWIIARMSGGHARGCLPSKRICVGKDLDCSEEHQPNTERIRDRPL